LHLKDKYLLKIQTGAHEYKIVVFNLDDSFDFRFCLSLQPTGEDSELPSYQPLNKQKDSSEWINENLVQISNWIFKSN
jgi:hypothetical protein